MRVWMVLVFLHACLLQAQEVFQMTHQYTQLHGLSQSAVYAICQDARGFLWLATREGLNRFDGHHFTTWYHQKKEFNSLAHNSVHDLLEYQPGLLLIATANGLCVLNTYTGQFENHRISSNFLRPRSGANVASLFSHPDGTIWVNQNGEIDILNDQLQFQYRLTELPWARGLKGSMVRYEKWVLDSEGRVWLPTDTSGIQIIDLSSKEVYNSRHNPFDFPFMQFQHIRAMHLDEATRTLLIAPWGSGVFRYDLKDKSFQHQDFGQPLMETSSINAFIPLENGRMICSSNGSFYSMDPVTLQIDSIDIPALFSPLLDDTNPICFLKSGSHRVWIGANEGLYLIEDNHPQRTVMIPDIDSQGECLDIIMATDGDAYALYNDKRLLKGDISHHTFESYRVPVKDDVLLTELIADAVGRIWIGTSHGILWFDTRTHQFLPLPPSLRSLSDRYVNAMCSPSDGTIWISTRQPFGLYRYKPDRSQLDTFHDPVLQLIAATGEYARISSIIEDDNGRIWIRSITCGTILQFDPVHSTWQSFPSPGEYALFFEKKGLHALYPAKGDCVWGSTTTGDGLFRYDWRQNTLNQFTMEDGLLSDFIYQIEFFQNNLYLVTTNGYTRFDVRDFATHRTKWMGHRDEFEVTLDTTLGQLILATKGKWVLIDIREQNRDVDTPVPVIDGVRVNHHDVSIGTGHKQLRLRPDQKNITIAFTCPHYRDASGLVFEYLLVGADQEWQASSSVRMAQYASLSPGTYEFRVRMADDQGRWNEMREKFVFTIAPAFWQRPVFILAGVLGLAGLFVFLARRRMKAVQQKASLMQQMAETERMALRAQMNPHFIFNSLNSIDALIMNDDKFQATRYLNTFARLIRNVLDSSKENTVTIEHDIETLRLYVELEQLRSDNAFAVNLSVDPEIQGKDIRVPPLIIQPYVENAILHGLRNRGDGMGRLEITIAPHQDGLYYCIEDNGVGREYVHASMKNGKSSYGMQMSSDRVRLFNQEEKASVHITDLRQNGLAAGTKVEVILKIPIYA